MRTKALLVTAALGAVGIATVMADPVYSVNVVGFINVTVPANGYALVANQLNGTNNLLQTIMPTFADGGMLLTWNASIQGFAQFFYLGATDGWVDGGGNPANPDLSPGKGFFLQNPNATPQTVTFVGEVPQGTSLSTTIAANYSLVGSIPPLAGDAVSLAVPMADGNMLLKWDSLHQGYVQFFYLGATDGWVNGGGNPEVPALAVGEGFFVLNGGPAVQWTQNFSVQ